MQRGLLGGVPIFAPTTPNNLEYLLTVSKNLAQPLHPIYDDGKGGDWKWWECHFVLLKPHISVYARCLARKVCCLVRSTWRTSQGEDKPGARDKILGTKVARRACARRAPGKFSLDTHLGTIGLPTWGAAQPTHPTQLTYTRENAKKIRSLAPRPIPQGREGGREGGRETRCEVGREGIPPTRPLTHP